MKGDLGIEGELPGAPKKDETAAEAAADTEEGDSEAAAAAEEPDHTEL
jgi:hypothetical protein